MSTFRKKVPGIAAQSFMQRQHPLAVTVSHGDKYQPDMQFILQAFEKLHGLQKFELVEFFGYADTN